MKPNMSPTRGFRLALIGIVAFPSLIRTSADAATISGTNGFGVPVISGASTTITFDDRPNASFSSLTVANVTFSGIGGNLRTDNSYPNQYNGRGARYLDNNAGSTPTIRFDFATPVAAFAFNWGASDVSWVLRAYDSSNNLIESFNLPLTNNSNAGNYYGLSNPGMKYATLSGAGGDYVFVDNFTYSQIPEPSAVLMGILGTTLFLRRRRAPGLSRLSLKR